MPDDDVAGLARELGHADRDVANDVLLANEALDGQSYTLAKGDLAIWDDAGPVAIAGVIGGTRTAVHDQTKNLFLESALFDPSSVRATSRRLGLTSESSYRFERGTDAAMVEQGLLRAASLIVELAGGEIAGGMAEAGQAPAAAGCRSWPRRNLQPLPGSSLEGPPAGRAWLG